MLERIEEACLKFLNSVATPDFFRKCRLPWLRYEHFMNNSDISNLTIVTGKYMVLKLARAQTCYCIPGSRI